MRSILKRILRVLIPLAAGGISAFITRNHTDIYSVFNRPPLSPPAWVFPVVWSILYLLMGIGFDRAYLKDKRVAAPFAAQLIVNIIWPVLFFNLNAYLLSALWLTLLIFLAVVMTIAFYKADKWAAYLQIPYLLWLLFALYLNIGVYMLN